MTLDRYLDLRSLSFEKKVKTSGLISSSSLWRRSTFFSFFILAWRPVKRWRKWKRMIASKTRDLCTLKVPCCSRKGLLLKKMSSQHLVSLSFHHLQDDEREKYAVMKEINDNFQCTITSTFIHHNLQVVLRMNERWIMWSCGSCIRLGHLRSLSWQQLVLKDLQQLLS